MNLTIGNNVTSILYNGNPVSELVFNGHSVWKNAPDYSTIPMTFKFLTSGTLSTGSTNETLHATSTYYFKYRKNNGSEQTLNSKPNNYGTISVSAGDIIEWTEIPVTYGSNNNGDWYHYFTSTAEFIIYGNLYLSTIDNPNADYRYYGLFKDCTNLKNIDNFILGNSTLSNYKYSNMFSNTGISSIPNGFLQSTDLKNYCYSYMFNNCASLVNVPSDLLPAINLKTSCYGNMFRNCTSLITAPKLPAINLVSSCYTNMFYGCTNLNYIYAMFITTPSSTYTSNWLYNVSSTGTFVKNGLSTWSVSGASGIPSNWTQSIISGVTIIPSGTFYAPKSSGCVAFASRSNVSNMQYASTHSANYAQFNLASDSSSAVTNEVFAKFDYTNFANIPNNATIKCVYCNVRYKVSSKTYVSAVKLQLAKGQTPKGTNLINTLSTTQNVYTTVSDYEWTKSDLDANSISLQIQATHNLSTSAASIWIYGADINILYE